jgi:transposase
MHVFTTKRKRNNKVYTSYFLAQSYWNKEKKQSRTRLIARLTGFPDDIIQTIKQHLKAKEGPLVASEKLEAQSSKDHGLVAAYWGLGEQLGLWKILNTFLGTHTDRVIGMVLNRMGDPKAKYSLRDWLTTTTYPDVSRKDMKYFHYNRCYETLDVLSNHHISIEDELQKQSTGKRRLVLYDLTSSYFEGEGANEELIRYGYNRDKKKGKKQIVIGLVTNEEGLPLSVEVLPGNTPDRSVLKERIDKMKKRFKVEEVIVVFDRGMATQPNKHALQEEGIDYITAMNPSTIKKLIAEGRNKTLQLGLFDKKDMLEITVNTGTEKEPCYERLIVCQSEAKQGRDKKQHQRLMKKTEDKLTEIQTSVTKGTLKDTVKIAKRVGKWINKWKCEKYYDVEIGEQTLTFKRNKTKLDTQELLYGMYVLSTSNGIDQDTGEETYQEGKEKISAPEVHKAYQALNKVEGEFRILKSTIEVRPMRHWKTSRIKGHVFMCFLSLWLQWHFEQKLKKLWKQNYTRSQVRAELIQLKSITLEPKEIFKQPILTKTNALQKEIFKLLGVTLTPPPSN